MKSKTDKVFIIAEAGVNHNGDVELAKKLIDVAVDAGADAVKFQTFNSADVISRHAPKAEYQKETTDKDETQLDMVRKLELSKDEKRELCEYAKKKGIIFLSTPFDLGSVDFLNELGLSIMKIPSGEITNLPYLRKIGNLKKKVIMSTGMAEIGEIKNALDVLTEEGTRLDQITLLHCNTAYPTPVEDVNLKAMATLRDEFKTNVGFSDHTLGIEVPIAAAALGAKVIEKHFTLDVNMAGPDHKASLEPHDLKQMVKAIRNIETALGNGFKKVTPSEAQNKEIARKSIVAAEDVKKNEVFSDRNITTKRPGTGVSPMDWDKVIGKKAKRDFKKDEIIEL